MSDSKRIDFLKKENQLLNKHKSELLDKIWYLECELKELKKKLEER